MRSDMSPGFEARERSRHPAPVLPGQDAGPGEHLRALCGTGDDHVRLVRAFTASALATGDRLVYVAAREPGAVARVFDDPATDVDALRRSGQLLLLDFAEVYGNPDLADADAVL